MKTIHKFELEITETQSVVMPGGAKILGVKTRDNAPVLYAIVDTHADTEERIIEIFGTGHEIHYGDAVTRKYIGTCIVMNDALVLHVFECINV